MTQTKTLDLGPGRAEPRKEKPLMKSKVLLGMFAVIGLLALSAAGAQAGGGGTPTPLTSFFVCNSISGEDAGLRVNVGSSFWNFNPLNVRIGNATLGCAFAKLFDPTTGAEINPNPNQTFQQLKCYSVSVSRSTSASPPPSYTVTDSLLGTDPDVTGSSFQYICAPAGFTQNP
jgi:hypothetical protein